MNQFEFFVYNNRGFKENVDENHYLWNKKFPSNNCLQELKKTSKSDFTYGDYFKISSKILGKRNFKLVLDIIKIKSSFSKKESIEIKSVFIFLEKHGSFYHPSKVLVVSLGLFFTFNLAVSKKGRECIKREVSSLDFVNKHIPYNYSIKLYSFAFNISVLSKKVSFFISEWLSGYKEFHLLDFQSRVFVEKKNNFLGVW